MSKAQSVVIRALPRSAVVDDDTFKYLQGHLGEALPLFSVTFDRNGGITTFAVHMGNSCASVFMHEGLEFDMLLNSMTVKTSHEVTLEFKQCVKCGNVHLLSLPVEGYRKFQAGMGIQYALPNISDETRELLLSSVCPKCWKELMK